MNARTDLEGGPAHSVGGRRGRWRSAAFPGCKQCGSVRCLGSARSHCCRDCAQGKQPGRTRHTSTATGKPRWDEGFPGMPRASSPTRPAVSEVVANAGRTRGTSLNTSAAYLRGTSPPGPARSQRRPRAHYQRPVTALESLPLTLEGPLRTMRGDPARLRDLSQGNRRARRVENGSPVLAVAVHLGALRRGLPACGCGPADLAAAPRPEGSRP